MIRHALIALAAMASTCLGASGRTNIVYILCDDLGYGDVRALNPERSRIATPHIDRLAKEGMAFTDAHSCSSVCTPSRYGILTGRYAWRTRLQSGVLDGRSPPLIARDRLTVASLLRDHGYETAILGKWHLGMTFGGNPSRDAIVDGPLEHGFTHFFGISASLDMPPFAFIEDRRFTQPLTVEKTFLRSGPAAKDFEAVDVLPALAARADRFIRARRDKPFFLYLPLTSPHTPIVPSPNWQGKSAVGPYGDFVMQCDEVVGQVLRAIDEAKLSSDTLVLFTSDNGCSPAAGVVKLEAAGHFPSAEFRGYKADIWEGGHRIPFIVRWPGVVKPGTSDASLVSQTDLLATCAQLLGVPLPPNAGEDSISMLPLLDVANAQGTRRTTMVQHSIDGRFAIRDEHWKLELCPGSGGWSAPRDAQAAKEALPAMQLYELASDPSEQHNVAVAHHDVVRALSRSLGAAVANGRTTPGPAQANDVDVSVKYLP